MVIQNIYDNLLITSLGDGDVVVMPTDTVYGLACSALKSEAVKRMYDIKRREGKPGTILAGSIKQLIDIGFSKKAVERANPYWPAPISVILVAPERLSYLHMGIKSLAVRIPAVEELRELLLSTGPLATTSANYPGEPTITRIEEAKLLFAHKVVLYIDGGDKSGAKPSKIIRLLDNGEIETIR